MDRSRMIAIVAERLKVRLDEDDPAFVLVELNRLALQETARCVVDQFAGLHSQFEDSLQLLLADHEVSSGSGAQEIGAVRRMGSKRASIRPRKPPAPDVRALCIGAVLCVMVAGIGMGGGYWLATSARDSDAFRARNVLGSAEGRAAVKLAELGQARLLLDCAKAGWTQRDGYCYGTAKEGRVTGWRVR